MHSPIRSPRWIHAHRLLLSDCIAYDWCTTRALSMEIRCTHPATRRRKRPCKERRTVLGTRSKGSARMAADTAHGDSIASIHTQALTEAAATRHEEEATTMRPEESHFDN